MAITKVMHMKASSKARIDIHLEHSINYILQPKKLGETNLVGGINCLPDMAYQQMKATKQMFGKTGGRQGYHFVISLNPTGKKAYIMNMYTVPEYRRQGIAIHTLDLLVNDAREQGVSQIALEATDMGRPLYEKYGFVKMEDEMELI